MEEFNTKAYQKIGIQNGSFSNLMTDGVSRIGLEEVTEITCADEIQDLDLMIVTDEDTSIWTTLFLKCEELEIPVMFVFNFGIGSCLTVWQPNKINLDPDFLFENRGKTPCKWMLDYTRGFNSFWNVTCHGWLDSVENWLVNERVKNSIGVFASCMAVVHTLMAMISGTQIETFPKFYLLSMVNQ